MTVSYFVFYRGCAADRDAFLERYRQIHVPILLRFPKIRDVKVHAPLNLPDTHSVTSAGFMMIAEMVFACDADLVAALASPERAEAREDFKKFPPFDGDVWHQAMTAEGTAPCQSA